MPELECDKCGYEWEYTGEMHWATCPRCKSSVKVNQGEQE